MVSNMLSLAVVPLIVWLGVFCYMLAVDRKLARIEAETEENDL